MSDEFNWKSELKDSFKNFWKDMWYSFNMFLAILLVLYNQTDTQLKYLDSIIIERNWTMILIIVLGTIFLSAIVEKILTGTWIVVKSFIKYISILFPKF